MAFGRTSVGNDSADVAAAAEPTGGGAGLQPGIRDATRDIAQRWGRVLGTAAGTAVLAGAGQLGVGYGLGLVWFDRQFPDDGWWSVQLTWVAWFAALAVLGGGMGGAWAARRIAVTLTLSARIGVAAAAGLGAAAVIPLTALPAEAATVVGDTAPATGAAVAAALGVFVGIVTTAVAMVVRLMAVSLVPLVALVWTIGLVSGLAWLASDGSVPLVRLAVLDLPAFSANRSTVAILCVPLVALLICGAIAGLARSRQLPPLPTAMSSTAAPGLLAFVYLIGSPSTGDRAIQTSAYAASLIAVAVGLLVSLLVGVARMPARRPATTRSTPASPTTPAAEATAFTPPASEAPASHSPTFESPASEALTPEPPAAEPPAAEPPASEPLGSEPAAHENPFSARPALRVEPPEWARPPAATEPDRTDPRTPEWEVSEPESTKPDPVAQAEPTTTKPWSASDAWPITLPRSTSRRSYSTPSTSDPIDRSNAMPPRPETPPPAFSFESSSSLPSEPPRTPAPEPGAETTPTRADQDQPVGAEATPPGKKPSWREKVPRLSRRSRSEPDPAAAAANASGAATETLGTPSEAPPALPDPQPIDPMPGLALSGPGFPGQKTPERDQPGQEQPGEQPAPTSPTSTEAPPPAQTKPGRRDEEEHLDWISSLAGKTDEDPQEPGRRRLRRDRELGGPVEDQGEPGDF